MDHWPGLILLGVAALAASLAARLWHNGRPARVPDEPSTPRKTDWTAVTSIVTAFTALAALIGGVYALERLALDSPRDRDTVTDVIAAFVRSSAPRTEKPCPQKRRPTSRLPSPC